MVASSLMAVMAQRLVRVVCPKCAERYEPSADEFEQFTLTEEQKSDGNFVRGAGCKHCQHTGYRGRKAVFELMTMNSALREMTFRREPTQNLRRQARLLGMKTLVEDAVDKVTDGVTTFAEAVRLERSGH